MDIGTYESQYAPVTFSGTVFSDANSNGSRDAGETGVSGMTVYLDANGNGTLDSGELTTSTDGSGAYNFPTVLPGTYSVRLSLPAGWTQTDDASSISMTVNSNQNISGFDLGVHSPPGGTITGSVYNDANGNGVKDSGETTVSGQKMFLDLNRDAVLQSTEPTFTTGANGVFTFSGLAAGTYRVRMVQLSGYTWTAPTSGYYEVPVAAGQTVITKDYLEKKTTALG